MIGSKLNYVNRRLLIIAILGVLVGGGRVLVSLTSIKIFELSFKAFWDIMVVSVFSFFALYYVFRTVTKGEFNERQYVVFTLLISLFMLGYGVHFSADQLDIMQRQHISSNDPYYSNQILAYFLDEIFGHKLMFYPLFALFFYLMLIEKKTESSIRDYIVDAIGGFLFGGMIMLGTIEGQTPIETILFAVLILIFIIYRWMFYNEHVREYTLRFVLLFAAIGILVTAVAWYTYFGGFIQPSQLHLY